MTRSVLRHRLRGAALAAVVVLGPLAAPAHGAENPAAASHPAASHPAPSHPAADQVAAGRAVGERPPEVVALRDIDPTIAQEIRYAGWHNFTGAPVPGYPRAPLGYPQAPLGDPQAECLLTRQAAEALHAAQQQLVRSGHGLKVYDCYRPQRAVDHFVRWAADSRDQRMKAEFYPAVDKSRLFADGYIDEKSGHSRASTVDLTLVRLPAAPQRPYFPGEPLTPCTAAPQQRFPDNGVETGTGFDCFDPLAHTADPRVSELAKANRQRLSTTMESVGMANYPNEWWHFTLAAEPFPDTYFDFPISRG